MIERTLQKHHLLEVRAKLMNVDIDIEYFSRSSPLICLVTSSDYTENCWKLEMLKYFYFNGDNFQVFLP